MKNVLIAFMGSFNPPLNSHFSLAEQIISKFEQVEKIIFVPANKIYNKPNLEDNTHRYNMLKLVAGKNTKYAVSNIELNSSRQLYTIETLNILKGQYSDKEIWFAIGSDNLKELQTWRNPEELVNNFKCVVLEAEGDALEDIIANDEFLNKNKECFICLKNIIKKNVSSTFVRENIKQGKDITGLVSEDIYEYIKQNNLYM